MAESIEPPLDWSPNLTAKDRASIRRFQREVIGLFARADANPTIAFTVLLKCLGSLIGTQMVDDAPSLIARVQVLLPMYVEAFKTRELRIDP